MSGVGSQSPNWREALTAKNSITGNADYVTSTNNKLDVNATASLAGSNLPISGASTAVGVAIVDGSGNQITSFGGGTQYQELAATSPATGTLALGRYKLSLPTLTDGQMNEPLLDSSSRLLVTDTTVNTTLGTTNSSLSTIATNTTGVATAANQTTGNTSLSTIATNTTGVATAANQTTGNSSLSTIATNTTGLSTSANQTNGNQQTKITDGTNVANVVANDTGYNAIPIANGMKVLTFNTTTTGAQVLLDNTDVHAYAQITVVFTSVGGGLNITGQFAPSSGGTYTSVQTFKTAAQAAGNPGSLGAANGNPYSSPVFGPYFRLNISAMTSGTTSGFVILHSQPLPYSDIFAAQAGTWTVGSNSATGSAVPANAFYAAGSAGGTLQGIQIMSSVSDGQSNGFSPLYTSDYNFSYNGSTWDRTRSANTASNTTGTGLLGVGLLEWDGTNWQRIPSARFAPSTTKLNTSSYHITTNTTNTPTSSTAYVSSIAISAEIGGTTSTVTIQDKSGTPLKLVNGLATTAATTTPTTISFQTPILMTGGIDIITAGAAAGTVDVWVNWFQ